MNGGAANDNERKGRLAAWRAHILRAGEVPGTELDEMEQALSEEFGSLRNTGLDADEAFLVALKRLGERHAPTREFALPYARNLLDRPAETADSGRRSRTEPMVVFGLAALAAIAIRLPELFGFPLTDGGGVYVRNLSLFVFPCLAGYFGWKRRLEAPQRDQGRFGLRREPPSWSTPFRLPGKERPSHSPRCIFRSPSGWRSVRPTPAGAGAAPRTA